MTKGEDKAGVIDRKGLLARDEDFVRAAVEGVVQAALGAEMTEAIGAGKGELPLPHHKHTKSTNMLERLNQELQRRPHVVRIFPNAESCLRLVRGLAVEMHENWLEATRYLNMDHLRQHKKEACGPGPPDRAMLHLT